MKIRILSAADVDIALPMPRAIEAMRQAFSQLSAGEVTVPQRSRLSTRKGVTLVMPAYLHGHSGVGGEVGVKVVSVYEGNRCRGLPVVTASVVVLDSETGLPRAFLDGTRLTALRTGAAGGLAADLLARADADTVALFGAGVQARAQLQGLMAVRRVSVVRILSRTASRARELAQEIPTWPSWPKEGRVVVVDQPRQAVAQADVVIAATTSSTPVFEGDDLAPGTHVTGVGSYTLEMQEVDAVTVGRARVVVDSRQACLAEAGDLVLAHATIDAELGEILNGERPGRQSKDEVTFFKSVGVAAQDAAAAGAALAEAEARDLGRVVEF